MEYFSLELGLQIPQISNNNVDGEGIKLLKGGQRGVNLMAPFHFIYPFANHLRDRLRCGSVQPSDYQGAV